ncbi:MAG: methylated-DNA--[protein]-cysteine S-methyltransferase [Deltaproteobacteria bacterium]|nr:methylated-DNA--[protein]-cysteine S-methyltransferase [Deltaproteobacteria bacterium]
MYSIIEAPQGPLLIAETKQGLFRVSFGSDGLADLVKAARRWLPDPQIIPSVVDSAIEIQEYLDGRRQDFTMTLDLQGTEFQKEVWQALVKIPFGQTSTYGEIARSINRPQASRAVGGACGANPIVLIIPCHRVVGSSGSLTGFGGGLDWKRWLLNLEGIRGKD